MFQHEEDFISKITPSAGFIDFEIDNDDLAFLYRLQTQLYKEDRLSGDEMRNIAQKLDDITQRAAESQTE